MKREHKELNLLVYRYQDDPGDELLQAEILQRLRPLIRRLTNDLPSQADTDDLRTRIDYQILKSAKRFRRNGVKFTSYVRTIIHRVFNKFVTRAAGVPQYSELSDRMAAERDEVESLIRDESMRREFRSLCELLSPFQQDILTLHISSTPPAEICKRMKISYEGLEHALQQIRNIAQGVENLEPSMFDDDELISLGHHRDLTTALPAKIKRPRGVIDEPPAAFDFD